LHNFITLIMQWRKQKTPPASTPGEASDDKPLATVEREQTEAEKEAAEPTKAPLSNYWRILSYGSRGEHLIMLAAFLASSASGVAMPFMQIIFGNLTGTFNKYAFSGGQDQGEFNNTLDRYS
jgi:ATP-binding cassette, subfamily B (MDR/TAP), member 1